MTIFLTRHEKAIIAANPNDTIDIVLDEFDRLEQRIRSLELQLQVSSKQGSEKVMQCSRPKFGKNSLLSK